MHQAGGWGLSLGMKLGIFIMATAVMGMAGGGWPGFVAGAKPNQRPEKAPRIEKFDKGAGWYSRALKGVEKPAPESLKFLDDQGAWYTPFTRPNMGGPYDIRGLRRDAGRP